MGGANTLLVRGGSAALVERGWQGWGLGAAAHGRRCLPEAPTWILAPSEQVAVRPVRGLCCSYCTPLSEAETVDSTAPRGRRQSIRTGTQAECWPAFARKGFIRTACIHKRGIRPSRVLTLALEVGGWAGLEVAKVPCSDEGAAGAVGARHLGAKQLAIHRLHKSAHQIHCSAAAAAAAGAAGGTAGSARQGIWESCWA
jgi:hypothetical protein